jgi:hypothetical protein
MTPPAAMRVAPLFAAACLAFASMLAPARAIAQDAAPPDPSATPQPDANVRDPDFGVVARHFGLQRQVEMFQWRRRGDGGYERTWSETALDPSAFAPGHDNPPFPLRNRQWLAKDVRVDGVPLDPAVLSALGRWEPFRPSFSALPGNLAATFQPQGDGLGTAENPMAPEVGDLRIHWRELRLPPLADRIVLDGGRWRLKDAAPGTGPDRAAGEGAPSPRRAGGRMGAGLFVAFVLVFLAGFLVARRRRGKR